MAPHQVISTFAEARNDALDMIAPGRQLLRQRYRALAQSMFASGAHRFLGFASMRFNEILYLETPIFAAMVRVAVSASAYTRSQTSLARLLTPSACARACGGPLSMLLHVQQLVLDGVPIRAFWGTGMLTQASIGDALKLITSSQNESARKSWGTAIADYIDQLSAITRADRLRRSPAGTVGANLSDVAARTAPPPPLPPPT